MEKIEQTIPQGLIYMRQQRNNEKNPRNIREKCKFILAYTI